MNLGSASCYDNTQAQFRSVILEANLHQAAIIFRQAVFCTTFLGTEYLNVLSCI